MARPVARRVMWLLVGLSCIVLAGALAWQGWGTLVPALPKTLRVAVARTGGPDLQIMQALAREFAETGQDVRLEVIEADDMAGASRALTQGRVELAVVRPDLDLPPRASTVLQMRSMPVIVVSRDADALTMLGELEGRRVGILPADQGLAAEVVRALAQSGRAAAQVAPLASDDLAAAMRERNVDAILISAPGARAFSASAPLGRLIRASRGLSVAPAVPDEVSALVPGLAAQAAAQSALPSTLRGDVEEVLAASRLLMADNNLDPSLVARLTERIFYARAALARRLGQSVPFAGVPTENVTAATIPVHKGAIQYYEREQQTFLERWSDIIWIGIASAGALSSGLAWLMRRLVMHRRDVADQVVARIVGIGEAARAAPDRTALAAIAADLDAVTAEALTEIRTRDGSRKTVAMVMIALDGARAAIRDRRDELASGAARPALRSMPGDVHVAV